MTGDGITRRQAIVLGSLGVGAVVVGGAGFALTGLPAADPDDAGEGGGGDASGPADTVASWKEPEVLTSSDGVLDLDLAVAETDVVVGGATVRMMTYNGTVPGPTLHLRAGDRLRVRLENGLGSPTNLHTHGLHVSADGNSDNPFVNIAPGEAFSYEIELPPDHPSGVFWYHPHHHGTVADQLFAGLYGAIVVDDEDWSAASPRVAVVSDVSIDGGAVAAVTRADRMLGRTGEILLTNGVPSPVLRGPAGEPQRLLVVNACASRYLDLRMEGLDALVRGVDSARWEAPASSDRLLLAPGNRADIVVTMPAAPAELIAAEHARGRAGGGMMGGGSAVSPEAVVLVLQPDAAAPAPALAPVAPGAWADLRGASIDAARTVTMTMGMGGGAGMRFLLDGRSFAPGRVDQSVRIGTVEEWTIVNSSPMSHPFHLHVWPMQVVALDGVEVAGTDVRDVVDVPAGSSATVRIAFDAFPGRTVYHCHILDHEDLGMMAVVEAG
ncbi:multicopper oxidase family protein [Microbacter sp. GSS18]|nr:multicopper oxidase family protein [Microbacter sp. GSS18]